MAGDAGELLDVGLRAGGDLPEDDLLRHAPAERDADLPEQVRLAVVRAIGLRRRKGHAECHPAWDDRDLADRIAPGREHADEGMTSLVVGGQTALVLGEQHAARNAEDDLLERVEEVGPLDLLVLAPSREQGRLVAEVGQVGAHHAGRRRRHAIEVHFGMQRQRARVDLEDLPAPLLVGGGHRDAAVEAAGTQQRGVEHFGTVGGAEDDHRRVGLEAVHLSEDLVERLLPLVVAAQAGTTAGARAPDRVELVDEDDCRGCLLGLLEEIAHA